MKPHTSDFKNAIKEMGRELRGVITYGNTTLEEEIMSITPHYEANILKSVMKQLDLELSVDIPLETVINCQIGILVGEEYEMLNFGNYVVYSSEKQEDTNTYKIVCYDKILYAMKQNEDLGVTYPITIKNYLTALANKIGLTVASGTFYNQDLQIPSELYVGLEYTYRDILDEIAQATGSIICINTNDEIEVKYPNDLGSQTTVSGTNITISEHAGNKIVETIISGNSVQDGTPTPSNQVPINSAGDNINLLENTYTTSGTQNGITHAKNADGTMLLNGTATTTVFMILNTFNLPAGTYILSGCPNGGSENGYRQDILVGSNVITKDFGSGGSFTLNEDTSIQVRIRIGSGTVINNLTFKPMIAKGLIVRQYLPYGIRNINEVIQNKNSLNIPNNTVTASGLTATIENGIVSLGGTSTSTSFLFLIRNKLSLKAGTYTISAFNDNASSDDTTDLRVTYRNGNGIIARAYLNNTNVSLTFTLDTDLEEGCLQIRSGSGNTFNNFVIKPQLELGSSATSFVPHQEQNISIPCQQPMRSIGNVRDSFVKIDGVWYEKHNIGQIVLNGTESGWLYDSDNFYFRTSNYTFEHIPKTNTNDTVQLSNYFKHTAGWGTFRTSHTTNLFYSVQNSGYKICFRNVDITTVSDWTNWLQNHNVEVIYPTEEPYYLECTEEQITALENIAHTSLYSGDTHISSEGYLSITYFSTFETIDEEYLKDVNIDFSEVYGPVNSIVLSRAGESDNVYIQDETSVEQNGLCEIKIVDNQIMNFNDRDDYLPGLLSALDGLYYYINDFNSTGILYYEVGDMYYVTIGENAYKCLMLNDEITVTTGIEERIYTDLPEQSQTDYSKADKTDRRINQTYLIVDKQNQTIESVVNNVTEQNKKISQITQTVDELNSKIQDIADITTYGESDRAEVELTDVNESEPIMIKVHPTSTNISYLYPRENLYPSDTQYMPNRIVRFTRTYEEEGQTLTEDIDYELPDDLLRYSDTVYDEFYLDYDSQTCQVIKRCAYNADGTVRALGTEITTDYEYPTIVLGEGNYTITLQGYDFGYLYVRLMAKNIYTTQFYTKVETDSRIDQKANEINLGVNQTLTNYSTTNQMNSAITIKANEINSTVSQKVGKNEVISSINQSAEAVTINANKVNLAGKTINLTGDNIKIASTNFNVDKNGNVTANSLTSNNATITGGKLNVTGGTKNNPKLSVSDGNYSSKILPQNIYVTGSDASVNVNHTSNSSSHAYLYADSTGGGITLGGRASNDITLRAGSSAKITCYGDMYANAYNYNSKEELKKNIDKFDENAIDIILNSDLYKFNYKNEDENNKKHIGFIIGNGYRTPKEVIAQGGESIDSYSATSILWKAVQEQQEQIEQMKKEIEELKGGK